MEDLLDKELVQKEEDMETYHVTMKARLKKSRKKDIYDVYFYKSILINKKIYDIIDRDDFIYIYYDITENLNDITNKKEKKELVPENSCSPISIEELKDLFKKEDAMCKIKSKKVIDGKLKDITGTGFFLEINIKNLPFNKCLLTNNHIINEKDIRPNQEIILEYKNEKKIIEMNGRIAYTNINLDYTCIEINDKDNIKEYFKIDADLINNSIHNYDKNEIFILQYPLNKKLSFHLV